MRRFYEQTLCILHKFLLANQDLHHGLLGYETSLWTSWRVAHLIEQECGVKYHPSQAWRILRQLGWSCQRPVGHALERDQDKIRRWKRERWPEIKKKPKKRAAPSSSSTKAD
jgi:transposase